MDKGTVFLVGAGPGDPGLITLRGLNYIKEADCILYDLLIDPRLLEYAPKHCEKIFVGKSFNNHAMSQEDICALLAEKAAAGKTVVRLKGGDPYIFGRGGEEAIYLKGKGIPFRVVPGVSSSIAGPEYAGIPVTFRELSRSVHIVTARTGSGRLSDNTYSQLAKLEGTIVILMGLREIGYISSQLIIGGMSPQTPAAVISRATTSRQKTVTGTLSDIKANVNEAGLPSPAIMVIGPSVTLRSELSFFENLPLFGRTLLDIRPAGKESSIETLLEEKGAYLMRRPLLSITPLRGELSKYMDDLSGYDAIVFTSSAAAEVFFDELCSHGLDARALGSAKLCCIGSNTARELEKRHLICDIRSPHSNGKSFAETLLKSLNPSSRILLPQSEIADSALYEALSEKFAVDAVSVYTTSVLNDPGICQTLNDSPPDGLLFFSPSAAEAFVRNVDPDIFSKTAVPAFSIGPSTTRALEKYNFRIIESPSPKAEEFVKTIVQFFKGDDFYAIPSETAEKE